MQSPSFIVTQCNPDPSRQGNSSSPVPEGTIKPGLALAHSLNLFQFSHGTWNTMVDVSSRVVLGILTDQSKPGSRAQGCLGFQQSHVKMSNVAPRPPQPYAHVQLE